jgi:uncharacterized protein with FMN-binding domain
MGNPSVFPVRGAIALVLTAAGSALVIGFQPPSATLGSTPLAGSGANSPASTAPRTATRPTATGTPPPATTGTSGAAAATPATTAPPKTSGTASGAYKNGTYTGSAAQYPFGIIQVAVTISGGKITDVQTIAQPGDRHSTRINSIALPMLHDQALSVQSAQIDGVSGATWTSQAYAESLQGALDQAKA